MNFAVLSLFAKVFSAKIRGIVSFGAAKVSNPQKFSLEKLYFSPIHKSFLPRKFPVICLASVCHYICYKHPGNFVLISEVPLFRVHLYEVGV